ncbi:MAG: hypothetical protein JNG89_09545 [Planctomycetaceae bacterium]|nr:hypothetical protein [Planctomycetaceae bacterium]
MTALEEQQALDREFHAVLEQLETAAGTPLVSGEMERWLQEFTAALAAAQPALIRRIQVSHAPQLKEIRREDPEMMRNADCVQREDAWIAETIQGLLARADVLQPMVARIEPDEKRAETALVELGEQAVQLVARARKQEIALRTWLQEAFTRDRGVVD